MAGKAVELAVAGRDVRVSSPDKIYFPQLGVTKLEVIEYYLTVADGLLAAIGERPTTMERWPGGVPDSGGEPFYQKNPPKGMPEWVDTVQVVYPSGRRAQQVCPTEPAALAWMGNLGTLRFHPWPARRTDTELVDELRIDLDPQPGTDVRDAARAALVLREVLSDAGLTGWPKTSGGRGLHVFVPITGLDFTAARHAVIAIGRELARREPELVTTNWWKEERGRRVFVDFNQMAKDRTIAAAYSIRPVSRALASAPLTWGEVPDVEPERFTVRTMPARWADGGDRWAGYCDARADAAVALQWWDRDVANGEGEMPYPPDYPKMPGESPRVPPSRARKA